jgi:hypothetical protein
MYYNGEDTGYTVDNKGNVYGKTGKLLSTFINKTNSGSRYVRLHMPDKSIKNLKVSRIVAEAFVIKPEGCNCVIHKDGNVLNDTSSNLKWGSFGDCSKMATVVRVRNRQ